MARNISWDESVKENVLNLVEALLSQADDKLDDLEPKPTVHAKWDGNKLRVTGFEIKQISGKRKREVEVGTKKEHLVKLIKQTGKSLKLPKQKEESGSSQQDRELEAVQTILDCLKELGVREDEKSAKNQGYWKFTLTLKHQTAKREDNLEVVKQKWNEHQKINSQETSLTTPILSTDKTIDWQNICKTALEKQKEMTTNRLLNSEMVFDLNQIHVPLALVERKKQDKRQGDDFPDKSHSYKPEYEETQKFKYEEFLTVLKTSTNKKIAIIGEPGAGKTTLLQRIAFWVLENTNDLAIWIPLGNLPTTGINFKDYLLNNWLQNAVLSITPEIKADFDKQLSAGKVWLLLDGVDEMATSGNALSFINNWLPAWSRNLHFVLTCRLNVWEANPNYLSGCQTYRTLQFNQEQVKQFINNCFQNRGNSLVGSPKLGVELQQALNQPGKERIKDLVRNPLRLMLLCSTWQGLNGKLPDTKAELYQHFVDEVYRWKKEELRITPPQRKELNAKLKELALAAIDKEENRFSLRHKFVESVLGECDDELFQFALKVGWLNRVGVDAKNLKPVYAFFHPTFQEYFAALAVEDWGYFLNHVPDNPAQGIYRIFEPQWKEVFLLWLGREDVGKEEKEEFIKALVEFEDGCREWLFRYEGFYKYRAYFIAAVGIAEFRKCNSANKIAKQVVKWSFGENFNYKMQQKPMRRMLASRQMAERAKATLLEMHHPLAVNALIEVMHTNLDEYTRIEVAEMVGKIDPGNFLAIKTLLEIIHNSSEQGWQVKAVRSLGKIAKGNREAIAALVDLLHRVSANPDELAIRVETASSLFLIDPEHPDAMPVVEYSGLYFTFFQDAVRSGYINPNDPQWIACLIDKILSNPKNETEKSNRLYAIQHLIASDTNTSEAIAALINLILTNPDKQTLTVSVKSLGRIGKSDPKAIALLIELSYKTQNLGICLQAILSLGYADTNYEKVIWRLIELICCHPDEQIGLDAALSLGQILKRYPLMSAVTALKNTLPTQIDDDKDFHLYNECYEVLMHCAQTMPYPTFHEAWHSTP